MRLLGFIFISLIFSSLIVVGDYFTPGEFLQLFLEDKLTEILAVLVGLNVAAVVFLLGQLLEIEMKIAKPIFNRTKHEIKENALFLIFAFLLSFLVSTFTPAIAEGGIEENWLMYVANIFNVAIFLLCIFAIYEIASCIFSLSKVHFGQEPKSDKNT